MRWVVLSLSMMALSTAMLQTRGGELASPKGFTITYPDGWQPASKEVEKASKAAIGPMGSHLSAILAGPVSGGFADNLSVVVLPETFQINADQEKQLLEAMKVGMGNVATNIRSKQMNINGKAALSIGFDVKGPMKGDSLRQWQVYIPGKQQTYLFICSTLQSRWDKMWPDFKKMVYSAQIDVAK